MNEPVAWMFRGYLYDTDPSDWAVHEHPNVPVIPLYTHPVRDYRKEMLDFIDEFTGAEQERHPMFSEGYDLALLHMKQLIEGRS